MVISNRSKGQSAIEYLMTYGWMLMVVAIVGGAIFMTIQNSGQIQSISGLTSSDVRVEDFGVTDQGLKAELRAASSDPVEIVNFSISDQETGETVYASNRKTIPVAETEIVTVEGVQSGENTDTYDVEILYEVGNLENLKTEGSITGEISINSTVTGENSAPTASATANVTEVHPDEVIEFEGTGSSDSDGSIDNYDWDWDEDGNYEGNGSTTTYRYSSTGVRNVELKVTDNGSKTSIDTVQINVSSRNAPDANFTANSTSIEVGDVFEVNASNSTASDSAIDNYEWDWDGDGIYEDNNQVETHSYSINGTYNVELNVTDSNGLSDTDTLTVNVESAKTESTDYPNSIAHRWNLSDTDSGTVEDGVADADGSVSGLTAVSGTYTGEIAAEGDGTDDSFSTSKSDYSSSLLDGAFAIAFTIDSLPESGEGGSFVSEVGDRNTEGWQIQIDGDGGLIWYITDDNTDSGYAKTDNSTLLNDGAKHRVVMQKTQNGDVQSYTDVYVDGVSRSVSSAWSRNVATRFNGLEGNPYYFSQSGGGNNLDAVIDEIVIYNDSLNSSEVQTDYENQPWN